MADEKSIVKMNIMIHKKTGASFLVVYVIYVSLVYTDSKKTASYFSSILFHTIQVIYKIRDNLLRSYMCQVTPKKVTPSDQVQNEQQKRTPQNCCAFHTRPNRSTPLGPPGTKGYKVTKKIIHFSKHYLVISYD